MEGQESPSVPAIPGIGALGVEVQNLHPVAGDVLVLRFPPAASLEAMRNILQQIIHIIPEGVSVAALDSQVNVALCNVPEFLAMITKPEVTH